MLGEAELNKTWFPPSNNETKYPIDQVRPWERSGTVAVEFEDRGHPCQLWVEYGRGKVGFGQISVWKKGHSEGREMYVHGLLWHFGYMKAKRKNGKSWKKDESVRFTARLGSWLFRREELRVDLRREKQSARASAEVLLPPPACFLEPRPGALCFSAVRGWGAVAYRDSPSRHCSDSPRTLQHKTRQLAHYRVFNILTKLLSVCIWCASHLQRWVSLIRLLTYHCRWKKRINVWRERKSVR